jgi:hypothetical protein
MPGVVDRALFTGSSLFSVVADRAFHFDRRLDIGAVATDYIRRIPTRR